LRITGVDIIPISIPVKKVLTLSHYGRLGEGRPFQFVLTQVHTDEGITGIGECPPLPPLSPESQPIVIAMLKEWIIPQVLCMDPFDLSLIWEKMDFVAPTYPMSKAVLDIALWDIIGKKLNLPLSKLLGGSSSTHIPNVGLIGIGSPTQVQADANRLTNEGFKGIRLKIGPGHDTECVKALRETVGDDVTIRVDCNQGYSAPDAVKMIKAIDRFNVELVEQPTAWWDFKALAHVAKSVDTSIMPHESLYQKSDVKTLLDMGCIGVLGLKTYRPGGGITNARRYLEMAKAMNIPCLMHDDVELGVSLAAAIHIIAAYQKTITHKCELSGYPEWMDDDVITENIQLKDGFAQVPKGPGLGVELDQTKISKYTTGIVSCKLH